MRETVSVDSSSRIDTDHIIFLDSIFLNSSLLALFLPVILSLSLVSWLGSRLLFVVSFSKYVRWHLGSWSDGRERILFLRTPRRDLKKLLRMNVLHPAGVRWECRWVRLSLVVAGGGSRREMFGEIVWAVKVLGLVAREGKGCCAPKFVRVAERKKWSLSGLTSEDKIT